jgi:twitching motility protein PilI
MPGLNGYQATRTLTRDPATRNIPVIVCTTKRPGDGQDLGLAPGRPGLPGQTSQRPGVAGQDRSALDGRQGMSKKISLHEFQSYLAARLAGTSNQSSAGLLGHSGGSRLLAARPGRLGRNRSADPADQGSVDQTLVRGDRQHSRQPVLGGRFVRLSGKEATPQNTSSRLLLIGTRHGSNAALLVTRMIGLRNVEALTPKRLRQAHRPGHPKPIRTTKGAAGTNSRCENCWLTRRSWTLAFETLSYQGILDKSGLHWSRTCNRRSKMTFKPKLPAFLSRTPDPAGETLLRRAR